MLTARVLLAASLLALAAAAAVPAAEPAARVRRQLQDEDKLQPLEEAAGEELDRDKRKLEGATQAKFTIKNALLGFVFGKINSLIDAKTRFVDTLDKQNIEINKQYGIEPPSEGGLGAIVGAVGQALAPKLQLVTGLLGGASGASSGDGHGGHGGSGGSGGGLGSILSLVTSLSGSSSGGGNSGATVDTIDSSEEDDS